MKNLSATTQFQLQHQYASLLSLLDPLDHKFLQQRWRLDKWSIHEQLAHLGRYHEIFKTRIGSILSDQEPQFSRYKAEQDEEFPAWCQKDTITIIQHTQSLRNSLIKFFPTLSESDFQRIGYHPKFKKMTLKNWIEFFVLHESHHIYVIFRIIHEFGK